MTANYADDPRLRAVCAAQPYPLLFATISGAHLYGFPSPDSDYDLRGVHLLPLKEVVGLQTGEETREISEVRDGLELDLVTHDAKKFFGLMLRPNGYVLEQIFSPLVVMSHPAFPQLKELARGCITKNHRHHYRGFAENQWKLFSKEEPPRVKPLLYVYRVLLTGIHLMRTGEVEANLTILNRDFRLPHIDELVDRKLSHAEKSPLPNAEIEFHRREFERLLLALDRAAESSGLPDSATAQAGLNDLLVALRFSLQR